MKEVLAAEIVEMVVWVVVAAVGETAEDATVEVVDVSVTVVVLTVAEVVMEMLVELAMGKTGGDGNGGSSIMGNRTRNSGSGRNSGRGCSSSNNSISIGSG